MSANSFDPVGAGITILAAFIAWALLLSTATRPNRAKRKTPPIPTIRRSQTDIAPAGNRYKRQGENRPPVRRKN